MSTDYSMIEANATVAAPVAPIVSFVPAIARLDDAGTLTERKVAFVQQASEPARMLAATLKGKVGAAARETFGADAIERAATQAACGNFKPVADMVTILTGEACAIIKTNKLSARDVLRAMPLVLSTRIASMKADGMVTDKKTGALKASSKRKAFEQAASIVDRVIDVMDAKLGA